LVHAWSVVLRHRASSMPAASSLRLRVAQPGRYRDHDLIEVVPLPGPWVIRINADTPAAGVGIGMAHRPAVRHLTIAELPAPGPAHRRRGQGAGHLAAVLREHAGALNGVAAGD